MQSGRQRSSSRDATAMKVPLVCIILRPMAAASTEAQEKSVPLAERPGHLTVDGNCGFCHSLDYLRTNSPFLDRKGWQAEVNKMIGVFGAPIALDDATAIVDYLMKNYGILLPTPATSRMEAQTRGSTNGHHCRSPEDNTSQLNGASAYSAASDFVD